MMDCTLSLGFVSFITLPQATYCILLEWPPFQPWAASDNAALPLGSFRLITWQTWTVTPLFPSPDDWVSIFFTFNSRVFLLSPSYTCLLISYRDEMGFCASLIFCQNAILVQKEQKSNHKLTTFSCRKHAHLTRGQNKMEASWEL